VTLDRALADLIRAAGGEPDPAAIAAARGLSGVPDGEVPPVLVRALAALAAGPHGPEPLADAGDTGFWMLQDFAEVIPSAYLLDLPGVEGLTVPALGRSLMHRPDAGTWEVRTWPAR